jgi:putative FmdB family regulatory protein
MPLYEYECESCGATFEVIQKFSDHSVETCRTCGGKVRRLLSAPAIQFKGTGWYITDYARKGAGGPEKEKDKAAADKEKAGAASTESGAASDAASSTPASGSDAKSGSSASPTPAASSPSTTSSSDKK